MINPDEIIEWARRKRVRAHQAVIKNINDDHLCLVLDYWNEIIRALHKMYEDGDVEKIQELEQAEIQKAYELGRQDAERTGEWIKAQSPFYTYECSECGRIEDIRHKYCPNCGARMEGEKK